MTSPTAVRASSVVAALILAGCASDSTVSRYVPQIVTPYRMDIQQGNFITQDLVDKLAVGLTRDQVRFLLGTPLLTDVFHANRWDYVFRYSKGRNEPERRHLAIFFDGTGKVARWETDMVVPAPAAGAAPGAVPAGGPAPAKPSAETGAGGGPAGAAAAPAAAIEAAIAAVIPSPVATAPPAPPAAPEPIAPPLVVAAIAPAVPVAPAGETAPAMPASGVVPPVAPAAAPAGAGAVVAAAVPVKEINSDASPAAVLSVIESWRAAWSSRDVTRYLAMYAAEFAPPGGLSRAKWEAQRRERLKRAGFIVLKVVDPQVTITGDNQAAASFTQVYESDTLKESGRKMLVLAQQGGKWLIRGETFEK